MGMNDGSWLTLNDRLYRHAYGIIAAAEGDIFVAALPRPKWKLLRLVREARLSLAWVAYPAGSMRVMGSETGHFQITRGSL
jgi:hypothetical protein